MNLTVIQTKNALTSGYNYAWEKGGELAGHVVRILNPAIRYVQQDTRAAGALFFAANIVFFQVAFAVTKVYAQLFSKLIGNEDELTEKGIYAQNFTYWGVLLSQIVGFNIALAKGLRTSLSSTWIGCLSLASMTSYIALRLWINAGQKNQTD